ncbi:hypothetical protein, partial [Solihabitans fulvus]|uniref:hypothetical protein n=1 Tax=Solihabitans fulvus TaxID=1892852 RepID=UPI001CB766CC
MLVQEILEVGRQPGRCCFAGGWQAAEALDVHGSWNKPGWTTLSMTIDSGAANREAGISGPRSVLKMLFGREGRWDGTTRPLFLPCGQKPGG